MEDKRIAEPIRCEVLCIHYTRCYPMVNPVGCTNLELREDIKQSIERAGYTRQPEPPTDKVEAVAKLLAIQTLEDESLAAPYVWQWVIENGLEEEYYQRAREILKLFSPKEQRGQLYRIRRNKE